MTISSLETTEYAFCLRLSSLMKAKGLNIPKLSKKTGIAVGTIQRILTNPHSNPTYSTLKAIAGALDISIGELLGEERTIQGDLRKLKLLQWDNVLKDMSKPEFSKITKLDEYVTVNTNAGPSAFALRMKGTSMMPVFPEGAYLVFDPEKQLYDRAYVLVKLQHYPEVIFKQLLIDAPNHYIKSINPELANEGLKILTNKDEIIAVLVQASLNY